MKRSCHPPFSRSYHRFALHTAIIVTLGATGSAQAFSPAMPAPEALPRGAEVMRGEVSIRQSGPVMKITQQTDQAAVSWDTFDIGSDARVSINQPDARALLINRVTGDTGSILAGTLRANGTVVLVNPNGVVITPEGKVMAGAFAASTRDLKEADFALFTGADRPVHLAMIAAESGANAGKSAVINGGRIRVAANGAVMLSANTVRNEGTIVAPQGRVHLTGDRVSHSGEIQAPEGQVTLRGTVLEMERGAVNVSATDAGRHGGRIVFRAAATEGQEDAIIRIGRDAQLLANAGPDGNGGTVSVKATDLTVFNGIAEANGGEMPTRGVHDAADLLGGHGGEIEISGARHLTVRGTVEAHPSSRTGARVGRILFDPFNVRISNEPDYNHYNFYAVGPDSVINVNTLANALQSANVRIVTFPDPRGSQPGHISVEAPVNWSRNTVLTLDAAGDVVVNAPLIATGDYAGIDMLPGEGFTPRYEPSNLTFSGSHPSITIYGRSASLPVLTPRAAREQANSRNDAPAAQAFHWMRGTPALTRSQEQLAFENRLVAPEPRYEIDSASSNDYSTSGSSAPSSESVINHAYESDDDRLFVMEMGDHAALNASLSNSDDQPSSGGSRAGHTTAPERLQADVAGQGPSARPWIRSWNSF